jgi:hypothetical protein
MRTSREMFEFKKSKKQALTLRELSGTDNLCCSLIVTFIVMEQHALRQTAMTPWANSSYVDT